MTQEGLDKLKKDLADALAQRPVISAQIAEAREKGDLSENAEYDAARDAQGLLEVKIAKLKNLVANAKIIDESQVGTDKVQMLTTVSTIPWIPLVIQSFQSPGTVTPGPRLPMVVLLMTSLTQQRSISLNTSFTIGAPLPNMER